VLFLENNVDTPLGQRIDRWFAAYVGPQTIYLPLAMVSSGHLIANGPEERYDLVYGAMVATELSRPPAAEVEAYSLRVGNAMRVWVRIVNRSSVALSGAANGATVHALVWEDKKVGVTSRTIRSGPSVAIGAPVPPGGVWTGTLVTPALSGVDWSKLHTVALADYRPGGSSGAYDMLQAGLAAPADLVVTPASLAAQLHLDGDEDLVGQLALAGPYVLGWTAAADVLWLEATPGSGGVPATVEVRALRAQMPTGVQKGHLTFTATSADGLSFSHTVEVTVDLRGTPSRLRRRGVVHGAPAP